jgi:hypothetical protein
MSASGWHPRHEPGRATGLPFLPLDVCRTRLVGGLDSNERFVPSVSIGFVRTVRGKVDHLKQRGADLCPPDEQQWADRVEQRPADVSEKEWLGDVKRQGHRAGEQQ